MNINFSAVHIHVPNPACINKCKPCLSRMHNDQYENLIEKKFVADSNQKYYEDAYINCLNYARDNNATTLILTGTSEPIQNQKFLKWLAETNKKLEKPFRNIEIQTTGVLLDDETLAFLKYEIGVKTICLSLFDPFDLNNNDEIVGFPPHVRFDLPDLCKRIRKMDFNLRIYLHLINIYDYLVSEPTKIEAMFEYIANEFNPHQVTFKNMYKGKNNTEQDIWVQNNIADEKVAFLIYEFIQKQARLLEIFDGHMEKYSYKNMSVVIDNDCMARNSYDVRYLILRPNCKLYSKWDDDASLIL